MGCTGIVRVFGGELLDHRHRGIAVLWGRLTQNRGCDAQPLVDAARMPFDDRLALRRSGGQITVAERDARSEEHTSELQSLMRISYAVFCLKKKKKHTTQCHSKT